MIATLFLGFSMLAGFAGFLVFTRRRSFNSYLDLIELETRKSGPAEGPRSDLPPEVLALAARLGARPDGAARFAVFEQTGQMWQTPGGKPMNFTARQTVRVGLPGFLWRAAMGPMVVADYLVKGIGGLEVKLLGALSLVRMVGGAAVKQGELLRYLAELPWNPDAMLTNRSLDWVVVNSKTIRVATGVGEERGEITLDLDGSGVVARASAVSRPYIDKGRMTSHPWHGRFWDYQPMGGRLIPLQAEVAWVLDAGEFVYWRCHLLNWSDLPAPLRATEPARAARVY